jgi:muramidase (phage lysozyme)
MNRGLVAALVLAAVLFWPRRVSAETDPATSDTAPIQPQAEDNPDAVRLTDEAVRQMQLEIDLNAFLYMIRACEHRFPDDVTDDACYEIFYGGTRFSDLTDHPVITGELAPVPLPERFCKAAGLKSPCYSTAAGAYQFIRPTWTRLRNKLDLPDFSFASQDRAALELLIESGIVSMLEDGEIEGAIRKASKIWASLPGSTAQQNPKALRYALDRFNEGQRLYANAKGVELPPLP